LPGAGTIASDASRSVCFGLPGKYQAGLESKVPEAARAMIRQPLAQTKDAWQKGRSHAPMARPGWRRVARPPATLQRRGWLPTLVAS